MKKTITAEENTQLYSSLNIAFNSYAKLNPEKYTSLQMICYVDVMQEILIPFLKDLEPEIKKDDDQVLQEAHATWVALVENGDIDEFCRKA